ncbi:2-C-methyl-D-erythritol 4-phosphate cytidylyltransferase [Neosynechococcus sphagnicola]|uniref:2-C-methyl-D-erythritol 4-phosphate cytidylyltransferase n=1 Tax=Neosynechococcus sphagnicola TaxID=1501145 RepID=UPI0030841BF4
MGSQRNKLLLNLLGEPLIAWTLRAAAASREIQWIGIISQPEDWPDLKSILEGLALNKPVEMILGGVDSPSIGSQRSTGVTLKRSTGADP